jgi:diacylglycerol kinase (CTP)
VSEPTHQQHQSLKSRSELHLARKIWHCAGVLLMAWVFWKYGFSVSWKILAISSLTLVPLDLLRQKNPALNSGLLKVLGPVMRSHEFNQVSGFTYLIVGCSIMLILFGGRRDIVVLTMVFLAFGDPVASYFGIKYGRDKILGKKTLQGSMAAFFACTLLAGLYYFWQNIMIERLLIVAPLSGIIGAASELIPIGKMDDNFSFPILCSTLLWCLFYVYGGFA